MRLETKSERIGGSETLDMTPQTFDPESSNFGQVPLPPVMGAQIQLITYAYVGGPMLKAVLGRLRALIEKNKMRSWFTIYLCLFILLHSSALITAYARRRALKHGLLVGCPLFMPIPTENYTCRL